MQVGVTLPNGLPDLDGETVLDWARLADDGPFVSVALPDRLVYCNFDPMMTLAAAAAVTSRVKLQMSALILSLRQGPWVVKQIATLTQLAPGRVSLGVVVGTRHRDYDAAQVPFERRGRLLDEHLELLDRLRQPEDPEQSLGPRLEGLEIMIGGASPPALERLVRWGDGYMAGGISPKFFGFEARASEAAWQAAGKPGTPRLQAGTWFSSNEDPDDQATRNLAAYLEAGGPPPHVISGIVRGREGVLRAIEEFGAEGAQQVSFVPLTTDIAELEWLAEVVGDR